MAKGGQFENEICKILSLNWSQNKKDDIFARTDGSGGKATKRWKKGKETANATGDIGIADVDGKPLLDYFVLELKTGYNKKNSKSFGIRFKRILKNKEREETRWFNSLKAMDKWISSNNLKLKNIERIEGTREKEVPWDILDLIDSKDKDPMFEQFWNQVCRNSNLCKKKPMLIFRRNNKSICMAVKLDFFNSCIDYKQQDPPFITILIDEIVVCSFKNFLIWIGCLKNLIDWINE